MCGDRAANDRPVAYDPRWPTAFETEAARLGRIAAIERLHHTGSTAVPGLMAKPIIDMVAEVGTLEDIAAAAPRLAELGYEAKGEFGIAGRRYFRRHDAAGVRTHHLHVFAVGAAEVVRHLALRDYLRAHADKAAAYAAMKRAILDGEVGQGLTYAEAKLDFVEELNVEALAWRAIRPSQTP